MHDHITVKPERSRLVAFAAWAVAQKPKIRTVSPHEFGVPADLFTEAPEELLIGSVVDGHPYVPVEDQAQPPVGEQGLPESEGVTGEPLPPVPDEATPLEPAGEPAEPGTGDPAAFPCPGPECPRTFTTARGRDLHVRQAHPEA